MSNAVDPFAAVARFAKAADVPVVSSPAEYEAVLRNQGMKDMLHYGKLGLSVGAAAAGATGLVNLIRRAVSPPEPKYPGAVVTPVPVPARDEKRAQEGLMGHITDKTNFPWYLPGALAAGSLGLYGGWKGVDAVLNQRRKAQVEGEQEAAKRDFESALVESYGRGANKTAGEQLGAALDGLFDQTVKQGTLADVGGNLLGMYGVYALGTGAPAAYWAYQRARAGNQAKVLDKAMKMRVRRSYMSRPGEIYAVPQPVTVGGGGDAGNGDGDEVSA